MRSKAGHGSSWRIGRFAGIEMTGGSGTVFWVHGYTLDSSIWGQMWSCLPDWRHVSVDLPGHGRSDPLRTDESLSTLAASLIGLADAHAAEHVVGLSFGALVALQMVLESPDRFQTLTLGSTALGGGPQDVAAQECHLELLRIFSREGRSAALTERWLRCPPDIFSEVHARPELAARIREVVGRHRWDELGQGGMRGLLDCVQDLSGLRHAATRILLILGERDMSAHKRCAELVRRAAPGARREYLDGAGHLCLLEEPEASAALIAGHLRGCAEDLHGR